MPKTKRRLALIALLIVFGLHGVVLAQPLAPPDTERAPTAQERFVVFEGFLRPTCGICQAAAPQIDRLAEDYAGQPVVFLEQNVDATIGQRYGRWWAAYDDGGSVTLPLVMVDSGYRYSNGYEDFYTVYKGMVDAALANPPEADVTAYMQRTGDAVTFRVFVTNHSGQELSYQNGATVHALVYDVEGGLGKTRRFVRAAPYTSLGGATALPDGASGTFTLTTGSLVDVAWSNLHGVVLVDYRSGGATGPYHALQAAAAAPLAVAPEAMTFMVDPAMPTVTAQQMWLTAPDHLTWTLACDADWVTLSADQGFATEPPALSVDPAQLGTGGQAAPATLKLFDAGTEVWTHTVSVNAYLGPVNRVYLPLLTRAHE